ncbi:MAG: MarR family transcriptional regulator [Rhizobiales bacterium]|nr:MarR family transcriptional regulator [Hyphomicrobiales bacterium]OJU37664.1 MAG: MarR family transcriptional regulator [Rhizobiales bacterium 68-8]
MNARDSALRLVAGEADGYRLDEQVGYLLRKANQRHLAIFAKAIPDLTPPQFAALARLAEIGQASQNQLGQSIAMDAATIKGVIDRLKARGLVELSNHGSDRRRRVVSLTAAGRATVEALLPLGGAVSDETLAPLNPREAATLLKLLARLT